MRDQGVSGTLLDDGKLESAAMRPQTPAYDGDDDLFGVTAALIAGIALAHAYSDGNKRLSLLCGDTFLRLNGYRIVAPPEEIADQILAVVNRYDDRYDDVESAEGRLADWLREHSAEGS